MTTSLDDILSPLTFSNEENNSKAKKIDILDGPVLDDIPDFDEPLFNSKKEDKSSTSSIKPDLNDKKIQETSNQAKNKSNTKENIESKNNSTSLKDNSFRFQDIDESLKSSPYFKDLSNALFNNEENISVCSSILNPNSNGLKVFFVGEPSGTKLNAIPAIAELLYKMKKISSKEIIKIAFNEIPDKFQSDKLYVIYDLNDAIVNLFNTDVASESNVTMTRYNNILNKLLLAPENCYLILDCNKIDYKGFLILNPKIKYIFNKTCLFSDLSNKDIAFAFLNQSKCDNLSIDDVIEFLEKNRQYYPFKNQEMTFYLNSYYHEHKTLPPAKYNPKSLDNALENIVGLENIKDGLKGLETLLKAQKVFKENGIGTPKINLHMILTGSPGTGKTSISRIISHLLFDLGYIREDKLVEITSQDLISSVPGLTGMKTNRVLQNAMGGVLFIDEAYSLANCGQEGLESLAIIVKTMEDYSDDIVLIFAGYEKEMQDLIAMNSGLTSRIGYKWNIRDYTEKELLEILKIKLKNINLKLADDEKTMTATKDVLQFAAGRKNSGNGRFVDRLVQNIMVEHAKYILDNPDCDKTLVTFDSLPDIQEVMKTYR